MKVGSDYLRCTESISSTATSSKYPSKGINTPASRKMSPKIFERVKGHYKIRLEDNSVGMVEPFLPTGNYILNSTVLKILFRVCCLSKLSGRQSANY